MEAVNWNNEGNFKVYFLLVDFFGSMLQLPVGKNKVVQWNLDLTNLYVTKSSV